MNRIRNNFGKRGGMALMTLGWLAASVVMAQDIEANEAAVRSAAAEARGFSYFVGMGRQYSVYSEHATGSRVRSQASASSAHFVAGALYAVRPDWLVALDNTSDFAPNTVTERWMATGATMPYVVAPGQVEDRAVNGPLVQTNRFSLTQGMTRLQVLKRVRGEGFGLAELAFRSQSFKRFSFNVVQPNVVEQPTSPVVEESMNEVLLGVGYALESERVRGAATHYSLKASVAMPIWRRLENTNSPDLAFSGTRGWDARLEARYSVAVSSEAHIGGWMQYQFMKRARQAMGASELPSSQLRTTALGLELLWKL